MNADETTTTTGNGPGTSRPAIDVRVRALTTADLDDLNEAMIQPRAVWGTMQLPFRSPEFRRDQFEKSLGDPNTILLAAEVEGKVVGNLGLHCNGRNPRRKHSASLGMGVHDRYHGRGIGTALMHAAIDTADNWLNLRRIELDVYVDNEPAIALYTRFGFEVEGTLRDIAFRDGAFVDALMMSRLRR